ncbi:MAG: diacylglycerol/lipid kinase family protein [Candidatus Humimicrobiaceae bacterium]
MQKTLLVYNIFSGGINSGLIKKILFLLKAKGFTVDKIETSGIGEATEKIKKYIKDRNMSVKMVVVAGGDGMINEAINALAFSKIPLGIIPRGTGNAFAKDKKIPFSLEKAIDVLKPDNIKKIDLGIVNEKRYFLMMCSCGFDVKAISNLNPGLKKKFKVLAYVYHGVKAFFTYKPVELGIKINGENILCKGYFFIASNVRSYGFPMAQIAPEASIDDGLLDICVFMNKSKISFIANILAIFLKTHINFKNVFYIKTANELILEQGSSDVIKKNRQNTPMVQLDGDICCRLPVRIRIEKKALNIFLP